MNIIEEVVHDDSSMEVEEGHYSAGKFKKENLICTYIYFELI
jgi:hypothetical protein